MTTTIESSLLHNILGFFDTNGDVRLEKVQEFLDISRKEMAQIFGVSPDALRDERISKNTKERLGELAGALEFVAEIFKRDINKTKFWLKTPNPNFGGASPKQLIVNGRYQYVLKFILASKEGH